MDALENHPSIVMWVPFNEAWGQHRTVQVGEWIAKRDPSRLVNVTSERPRSPLPPFALPPPLAPPSQLSLN